MRKTSKKQTEASRINGGKSGGPTSEEGKIKSRLNALKLGLFSDDLVITAAGESVEEFELFKAAVWESVQPEGALQEILTYDLVANGWRRRRVRRCESADLRRRLQDPGIRDVYLHSDKVEPLRSRFVLLLQRYQAVKNSTPAGELTEIVTELEEARSQLASTSVGLEFLINKVNKIKSEANSTGQISEYSLAVVLACVGVTNDLGPYIAGINRINKTESAKAAERKHAAPTGGGGPAKGAEAEKNEATGDKQRTEAWDDAAAKAILVHTLKMASDELEFRKETIKCLETWQAKTAFADAVLPAEGRHDRFMRAETAFDRRFYRALAALLAIKQSKNASKILP